MSKIHLTCAKSGWHPLVSVRHRSAFACRSPSAAESAACGVPSRRSAGSAREGLPARPGQAEREQREHDHQLVQQQRLDHAGRVREVWRLMYVEDRSVAEVAELTGLPAGTVKSRAHRARQLLRAALGGTR